MYRILTPPGAWTSQLASIATSVTAATMAELVDGDWIKQDYANASPGRWIPVDATPHRASRPLWTNPQESAVIKGRTGWTYLVGAHQAITDRYDLLPTTPASPATDNYAASALLKCVLFAQGGANVRGLTSVLSSGAEDKLAVAVLDFLDSTRGEIHVSVTA